MSNILFSEEHEWILVEGDIATVGITDFAQKALGDVVFVELPEIGDTIEQGGDVGVVESVKAASEIYSPLTGDIIEVNEELEATPNMINDDAEGAAWLFKIKIAVVGEVDELMSADEYKAFATTDDD